MRSGIMNFNTQKSPKFPKEIYILSEIYNNIRQQW